MASKPINRDDEIRAIWKEYKFFYQVAGGLLLVGIGVVIGMIAFSAPADRTGYLINLYTSILSILVTVFVIDFLNRRRDERGEVRQLQEQLVRDAGSSSNEIAKNAIDQLRKRGWLTGEDGVLKRADLRAANLERADLRAANLEGADLGSAHLERANLTWAHLRGADMNSAHLEEAILRAANLEGTDLVFANLEKADLRAANLEKADLSAANLESAYLSGAHLEGGYFCSANLEKADLSAANLEEADLNGANLVGANLIGANLVGANLIGAHLEGARLYPTYLERMMLKDARLDETTTIPDGSKWTPDTDMTKFGCIVE